MKVLVFICFCLVLPLTGRQLENDVTLRPSSVSFKQAAETKQKPGPKTGTKTDQGKLITHDATTRVTEEKPSISSLFSYFSEPEFAGVLLLVAIVGLSGMKHAD
jgi:hypothetical protein